MLSSLIKNRFIFSLLLACGIAALPGGAPNARAATYVAAPFSQTVANAPIVVAGKIGNGTVKSAEGKSFTFYSLTVTEVLKGNVAGNPIEVRQLGGLNLHLSGSAAFTQGESVILLLNPANSDGSYNIHGLSMGKINVAPTGELTGLALDADRRATTGVTGHAQISGVTVQPHGPWSLDDLRNLLANPK